VPNQKGQIGTLHYRSAAQRGATSTFFTFITPLAFYPKMFCMRTAPANNANLVSLRFKMVAASLFTVKFCRKTKNIHTSDFP